MKKKENQRQKELFKKANGGWDSMSERRRSTSAIVTAEEKGGHFSQKCVL